MGFELGLDAKVYRNTGTWAAPTFDEVPITTEVTTTIDSAEAEGKHRGLTFTEFERGLLNAAVNVTLLYDGSDTDFQAFRDAFFDRDDLELFIADGPSGTSGTQGLRAEFRVLSMERGEPLEEAITVVFTVKPALGATNKPVWHEVA